MKKARSPLFIIFVVVFLDLVCFGIVIPILPYYARQFGASATALGWLMTSYSFMQFFFAPVWGRVSDRIGRRPVLLASMTGIMLSMVVLGFASSLFWLFAARTFAGICGANISTATAYIADVTDEKDRTKGMGMIGAAFGLGFIFGPAIGGVLSRFGLGTPMFAAAGLSLANIAYAYFKLPEPPITRELREQHRHKRFDARAFRETMGDSRTRMATLLFFVVTVAFTQMEVVFALFMLARHGFNAQSAGLLLAFMGIIMVGIQGGLIGKLSKRFGESRLVIAGPLLMALGLVLLAQTQPMGFVFAAMTLVAIGNGITNPSLSSLASKGAKPERRGATLGIYQSAGSLARVVGPPIAGWAYDALGVQVPFLIAAGTMAFAFWAAALWHMGSASWIVEARKTFRSRGFKGLLKTSGWKLLAAFFAYYLIRDITLYILLPWLAAKGLLSI
ncbi:MAG: MFS transporter [Deltaproteobacteria bacterium]|nr:MFS transporter [Deltaproteobacteria bacterium]